MRSAARWTQPSTSTPRPGLIFLKYISDAFEDRCAGMLAEWRDEAEEDRDEYIAENLFWNRQEARWTTLKAEERLSTFGQTVDRTMAAIEEDRGTVAPTLAASAKMRRWTRR